MEDISPHRFLNVYEDDEMIDHTTRVRLTIGKPQDFTILMLEHLKTSGVRQAYTENRIEFSSVASWPE